MNKGFSTVEILIAFALLIIALSGILIVVFGNDSFAIDSQLNAEALFFAEQKLNQARAQAETNFTSYFGESGTEDGDRYATEVDVLGLSPCSSLLTSNVSWSPTPLRENNVSLQSVVTSLEELLNVGGDCNPLNKEGDTWDAPDFYPNEEIIHEGSPATDVDVVETDNGTFALLTSEKVGNFETLWIIDVDDPDNPILAGSYAAGDDLLAIDAYADGNEIYAYTSSASSTAQLQVFHIDVTSYADVEDTLSPARTTAPLPDAPNGRIRSIYFYDDKVFVGTQYLACPPTCSPNQNHEFHIYDVSSPTSPSWVDSLNVNHNINQISVSGDYAYLATSDNNGELMAVNINSASGDYMDHPDTTGYKFNAPGNSDGTAVQALAGRAYLGRAEASDDTFFILDVSDLASIVSVASEDLDLNSNTEVKDLAIQGSIAFIVTSDQTPANGGGPFMVFDISDPENITSLLACNLNYSEQTVAMDYHDGSIYIADQSNLALQIVYSAPACS